MWTGAVIAWLPGRIKNGFEEMWFGLIWLERNSTNFGHG